MGKVLFHGADLSVAEAVCIVVHGRGQSQSDMMDGLVSRLTLPKVAFVLPKSSGDAWYDARAIDPLSVETRQQLAAGYDILDALIAQIRAAESDIPILLAGFSQGACLAVEYLLDRGPVVNAAAILTGCRVGQATDDRPMSRLEHMPVYATNGDADPWIPVASFHAMLAELTKAGARVRSDLFPGRPHEIDRTEIAILSAMLANLTAGRAALEVA
jgi:phospholipase/carboxylesterase